MTNPKIKPCPRCASPFVEIFVYESGSRRAECTSCWYMGPCEGSIRQAIKSHNEKATNELAAKAEPK